MESSSVKSDEREGERGHARRPALVGGLSGQCQDNRPCAARPSYHERGQGGLYISAINYLPRIPPCKSSHTSSSSSHPTHAQHATRNHGFRRFKTRNSRPDLHRSSRQVRREAFSRLPGPGLPPGRRRSFGFGYDRDGVDQVQVGRLAARVRCRESHHHVTTRRVRELNSAHSGLSFSLVGSQTPTLKLSQLILTNADPKTSLISRERIIQDQPVFNLELKGVPDKDGKNRKGVYPGPVTNQKASGRCWLFATSEWWSVLRVSLEQSLMRLAFLVMSSQLSEVPSHPPVELGRFPVVPVVLVLLRQARVSKLAKFSPHHLFTKHTLC
jgi:hypothetical protein